MKINIVSAVNGKTKKPLTQAEIQKDMPEIEKQNKQALVEHVTWAFFGGVITVGDHVYQIC